MKEMMHQGILKRVCTKVFLLSAVLVTSCKFDKKKQIGLDESKLLHESYRAIGGKSTYDSIYRLCTDSINSWIAHDLTIFKKDGTTFYKLDSLLCFSSSGKRVVGALHQFTTLEVAADGIYYFQGENIQGMWYFWTGGYTVILRDPVKFEPRRTVPSYAKLHDQTLRYILGGYLKKDGKINDKWITYWFEDGWVQFENRYRNDWPLQGRKIDDPKEYWKYVHKQKSQKIWIDQAIKDSLEKVEK